MILPPAFSQVRALRETQAPIPLRKRVAGLAGARIENVNLVPLLHEAMVVAAPPQAHHQQQRQYPKRKDAPFGPQEVSHLPIVTEAANG